MCVYLWVCMWVCACICMCVCVWVWVYLSMLDAEGFQGVREQGEREREKEKGASNFLSFGESDSRVSDRDPHHHHHSLPCRSLPTNLISSSSPSSHTFFSIHIHSLDRITASAALCARKHRRGLWREHPRRTRPQLQGSRCPASDQPILSLQGLGGDVCGGVHQVVPPAHHHHAWQQCAEEEERERG